MHGRSQEFSKRGGGGHTVSNRGYSPEYNVSCCRSFVLKKGLRRGGGGGGVKGTQGPPGYALGLWPPSRPWMMRPQLNAVVLSRLAQRRLGLNSPIRERKTFPHLTQVWLVFRSTSVERALFSSASIWICSSPALSCI